MFIRPEDVGSIYVKVEAVDMRKGVFGLAALVSQNLQAQGAKSLFVFCNKSRNRLRILYWDDTGFAYWHKALERDRFKWPKSEAQEIILSCQELRWLLGGVDISRIQLHKSTNPKSLY